jgi:N-acetylglucosamine kinase-like BadF-type ATPase
MRYVLGIDAGGTKTVGLLADEAGRVVAESRSSGANLQVHGELEVEKVFHGIIEVLEVDHPISAVCLGIAGVDRPHDQQLILGVLRRLGYRERVTVVNDAVVALVAGAPGRFGVVLLAGTGSIAYGQDRSGRSVRSGGYGFLLADEGSGYWLGHHALRAAVRATDGRGSATPLRGLVFEAMGVDSMDQLIPRVYEKGLAKHQVAALAGLVQKAADQDDPVAEALLESASQELVLAARAVASGLSFGDEVFPVVLAGGVFKACPSLHRRIERHLDLPNARPSLLSVEPAHGAVTLALDLLS